MNALRLALAFIVLTVPLRTGRIESGQTSCPASGAVQLVTASTNAYQLYLTAPSTNTGTVVVGGPTVTASPIAGFPMAANAVMNLTKPNAGITLQSVWFACTVTADKLSWVASE